MAQPDSGMGLQPGQQGIEKGKGRIVHALVVDHKTGNAGGKSLVQFCEKPFPTGLGAVFPAGVQVDIDG